MLIEDIQNLQTPAKYLLLELYHELADAIWIPNSVLPENFQHQKEFQLDGVASCGKIYGRSAKSINTELDKKPVKKVDQDKLDKEERIAKYQDMATIQYDENEPRLIRNMITFCDLMIENDVLDKHDFEEE